MLAKKNRLNLSLKENSLIFNKGESIFLSSRYFLAYLRKNEEYLKATCLSPKAIFKTAAARNQHRRLLYSFLEKEISKQNISLLHKNDLVLVVKRNPTNDLAVLENDFAELIKKINVENL